MVTRTSEYGPLMLRIGLGVVYLVHGAGKLFEVGPAAFPVDAFAGVLGGLGVPLPVIFAWIVALVETLGGLALLLGVLTRYAAALIAIDALVATLIFHLPNGFVVANNGFEFTLVNFFAAVALVFLGAGALSLEVSYLGDEWVPEQLRPAS